MSQRAKRSPIHGSPLTRKKTRREPFMDSDPYFGQGFTINRANHRVTRVVQFLMDNMNEMMQMPPYEYSNSLRRSLHNALHTLFTMYQTSGIFEEQDNTNKTFTGMDRDKITQDYRKRHEQFTMDESSQFITKKAMGLTTVKKVQVAANDDNLFLLTHKSEAVFAHASLAALGIGYLTSCTELHIVLMEHDVKTKILKEFFKVLKNTAGGLLISSLNVNHNFFTRGEEGIQLMLDMMFLRIGAHLIPIFLSDPECLKELETHELKILLQDDYLESFEKTTTFMQTVGIGYYSLKKNNPEMGSFLSKPKEDENLKRKIQTLFGIKTYFDAFEQHEVQKIFMEILGPSVDKLTAKHYTDLQDIYNQLEGTSNNAKPRIVELFDAHSHEAYTRPRGNFQQALLATRAHIQAKVSDLFEQANRPIITKMVSPGFLSPAKKFIEGQYTVTHNIGTAALQLTTLNPGHRNPSRYAKTLKTYPVQTVEELMRQLATSKELLSLQAIEIESLKQQLEELRSKS